MKRIVSLIIIFPTLMASAQLNYPKTKKTDVSDNYHGTKVEDPYRWLEDDTDELMLVRRPLE